MLGIIGIIASLTVLGLSLVVTRIATTALSLTGLSWEAARFQARSAFTGTGFTTSESEKVVSHPVRRKIIMGLMIARSAGLITIIVSLIISFADGNGNESSRLVRLIWLIGGVGVLWLLARSKYIDRWVRRVIEKALNNWTELEIRDYDELFKLSGDYSVREVKVEKDDWLAEKKLRECRLNKEGVLVLGIYRADGSYVGAPIAETKIYTEDTLILYGRSGVLENLDARRADARGEADHEKAMSEHRKEEAEQVEKERSYKNAREQGGL